MIHNIKLDKNRTSAAIAAKTTMNRLKKIREEGAANTEATGAK